MIPLHLPVLYINTFSNPSRLPPILLPQVPSTQKFWSWVGNQSVFGVSLRGRALSVQFSRSVVSDSLRPHGLAARQASLSITNSGSLLKLTFIESVIPSNHLILSGPLLLLPSIFPSIRIFSDESVLRRALCCSFFLYPSALC